jgi:hypothetical protein
MHPCRADESGNDNGEKPRRPHLTQEVQGVGATNRADLALLRRAIKEDWPVPASVRQSIVEELAGEIETPDVRRLLSVAQTFVAMEESNLRLLRGLPLSLRSGHV